MRGDPPAAVASAMLPPASGHVRAADLAVCGRLLARGSRSFSAAGRLLPRALRRDASVIYAYCRLADDAVDDAPQPEVGLARLRERLDDIYGSAPLSHPVDRAFRAVAAAHGIPRTVPDALLEGFAWDLSGRRYDSLSDLVAYSVRVASTVGLMMTLAMGVRDPWALARACELGVAMQLTNIARDVGEDARRGRVYLPARWLAEAGLDVEAWLAQPTPSDALGAVVARLLSEANALYRRAEPGIDGLPPSCRPAIWAARLIYADIGAVLATHGFDSVSQRAVVSGSRKAILLAEALLRAGWHRAAKQGRGMEDVLPEAAALLRSLTTHA